MALRFPNVLEPWTEDIYSLLSDADVLVRRRLLDILTHLVLNDMIKVKGQVNKLADCSKTNISR